MSTPPPSSEPPTGAPAAPESFTVRAWLLVPLYLLCYVPGLVCNVLWLRQAIRVRRVEDNGPPGFLVLNVMIWFGLVVLAFYLCLYLEPPIHTFPERARISRVRSDQGSLATAIEAYKLDHGVYPAYTFDRRESVGARTAAEFEARHGRVPTFRTRGTTELQTITTPVAYLDSIFEDLYLQEEFRDHGYAYWTDGGGWIVWSPGPDGEYAITDPSEVYTSEVSQPSLTLLLHAFDPTNGTTSPGDVFRVRQ